MAQILESVVPYNPQPFPTGNRKDIMDMAGHIAYFLRETLGLKLGERVAIISPNSTLYTPVVLGILRAGLVAVPLNPLYSVDELTHPMQDSEVSVTLAFPPVIQTVRDAMEKAKRPLKRPNGQAAVWIMHEGDSVETAPSGERDFRAALTGQAFPAARVADPADQVAFIVYSSGTSGKPKGVLLTHLNLKCNSEALHVGSGGDISKKQVTAAVLPMFHIFGLNVLVLTSFLVGMPIIVIPRFELEVFCQVVQKHKVTLALVVPPMIVGLAKHPIVDKYDLSSLQIALSGAAPLGVELGDEVERRLPNLRVTQGYGLSETSPVACFTPHHLYRDNKGTCGRVAPGARVRLVDEAGKDVAFEQGAAGVPGEIWVQGDLVMKGYQNNPEANAESLTPDHWFKTGDVAICKNSFLYIVDRKKELIKYKGFQVAPAELEGLMHGCPDVADVAVIGIYDKSQATELPRAYVVPAPASLDFASSTSEQRDALSKRIVAWVGERVANHKKLRGGVVFLEAVPKSPSGKILRRLLRDDANKAPLP